ncbi:MAG: hypothetical protein A2114_00210 [Candidatus Vogelbacteria bacterium GWA1_51_14]|uniref:Uncharacterized protein n=1 Tax=Candidatus Vogelbacteria bacterium GWA1_51_14 TaxID=1802435 RepID=A0A1G2Q8U3_9BACT|nr:MAG: hypothetical protein A2114_00210 [Candidatus Vogelbacteria bacterium GWA1_51_14]
MKDNQNVNDTNNQSELVKIRNGSPLNTEPYQRAKDKIRDIQLDTNNIQTAGLQDFIKSYKEQSDKTNNLLILLTVTTIVIGILGLVIDLVDSSPKVKVTQIEIENK